MDKLNLPAGCSYGNRTKRPLIFSHSVQCLSGSLSILIGLKLIYSPLFYVSHFISKIYKLGYHFYSVSLKQYRQHLDKTSSVQKPKGVHSHGLLTYRSQGVPSVFRRLFMYGGGRGGDSSPRLCQEIACHLSPVIVCPLTPVMTQAANAWSTTGGFDVCTMCA